MSSEKEQDSDESHTNESSTLLEKEKSRIIQKEKLEPRAIMQRFLNILPGIPQISYLTKKHQVSIDTPSYFRFLGAGTCSQVFEIPSTSDVFKVANDPGSETDHLWNEYYMHTRIVEMTRHGPFSGFEITKQKFFVSMNDTAWWSDHLKYFPPHLLHKPANLFCYERILPLSQPHRNALIDRYAPDQAKITELKADPANRGCLARIYLGKRRETRNDYSFQVRNFNLHLDQMEDLGMNYKEYGTAMGKALATLHWGCFIDGKGVEFVLGSPGEIQNFNKPGSSCFPLLKAPIRKPLTIDQISKLAPNTSTWQSYAAVYAVATTKIWMLDFSRCSVLSEDKEEMKAQLMQSFFGNCPYYPRPSPVLARDGKLWELFRQSYEITSADCIVRRRQKLMFYDHIPGQFMNMVEAEQRARMERMVG
jgi:hypothetical protein